MWHQLGPQLNGTVGNGKFGSAVAISASGDIVAFSSEKADAASTNNAGCTRVFKLSGGGSNWSQIGGDICGTSANDMEGESIALSSDGLTL